MRLLHSPSLLQNSTQQQQQPQQQQQQQQQQEEQGGVTNSNSVSPWTSAVSDQYQHNYYQHHQYPEQAHYHQQPLYQHYQHQHQQPQQQHHQQQQPYPQNYYLQHNYTQPHDQQQQVVSKQQQHYQGQSQQQYQEQYQQQYSQQHPQAHQQFESGVKRQCWVCGAVFQDVSLFHDHLALLHPDERIFKCTQCLFVFPSHAYLVHHYNTCHLVNKLPNYPGNSRQPQTQYLPQQEKQQQQQYQQQPQQKQQEQQQKKLLQEPQQPVSQGCHSTQVDSKAFTTDPKGPTAVPKTLPSDKTVGANKVPLTDSPKPHQPVPNQDLERKSKERSLWCVQCHIKQFTSLSEFEAHHTQHVREKSLRVHLKRLRTDHYKLREPGVKVESSKKNSSLKLKLKISKVGRGRSRKRREVKILSEEEGMSDTPNNFEEEEGQEAEPQESEGGEEGGATTEVAAGEAEKEESGGESEEQEASRSSSEAQEREDQFERDSLPGHDRPDSGREQDGHLEDPQDYPPDQQDYQEQNQQDDYQQEGQGYQQDLSEEQEVDKEAEEEEEEGYQEPPEGGEQSDGSNSGFNPEFGEQELPYSGGETGNGSSQSYQPQFESYPTAGWFTDYESGPRIAAAMAGATAAENSSEGGPWTEGTDGAANPSYSGDGTPPEKDASGVPVNGRPEGEGEGDEGLFSQAVLGQESPEKTNRQGSFEQLCLNDSYSGQAESEGDEDSQHQQQDPLTSPQEQQQHVAGEATDLLSELEYLNNSGQAQGSGQSDMHPGSQSSQIDGSPHSGGPSPHSAGPGTPSHLSSRGSNSGTPTSSGGHPTPPPTDTSFRALATSPITSPSQQPTSPSLHKGPTPPATSPQAGDQQAGAGTTGSVPRLTIANNLMAPTTTTTNSHMLPTTTTAQAGVGSMMGRYGAQWSQAPGYSGASGYPPMPGTSIAGTNMPGPLRAPLPPNVGMQYRPSPPPRVRGRPPLIGHVGRPPLHQAAHLQPNRGPGRPPASSILPPPLMPAPGGRGSMMPPLQRMHQPMFPGGRPAAPQQQSAAGKRQMLGAAGHSPSKAARREDINVPSRQKDNECQIIAVANRSDGLPVISNVQGGSGAPGSQRGIPSTSESTINLSDSITLSVRAPTSGKEAGRGERGGPEAGAVANLLASRGITVTPAAGERQDGGGGRDDRRLPTAQELNLSSAISVHPPTQREREGSSRERDRDGFAVPQAPPTRGLSNSNVERPPRPPTVDLTQDVPSTGSQGTRHKCHQCDRSFPTASLLADHSRVHQQQQQSRMPFKCHLCTAGFSTQKGQQHHYQQFHQLHLSAGDVAIPLVDLRSPVNVQRMAALGIRSFLPLTNLQNRGAGGVVGVPILTLENLRNGHMTLQQWGVSDVLSLGPAKTLNMPR